MITVMSLPNWASMRALLAGSRLVSARSPCSEIWKVSVMIAPGNGTYSADPVTDS
ncbi:Uncharacterised protein [Mycobacteroides abscessus subsp. abscessus]|nr:Uncharacterised protein [Mycobacteroides abscessus subsp. abscessus]